MNKSKQLPPVEDIFFWIKLFRLTRRGKNTLCTGRILKTRKVLPGAPTVMGGKVVTSTQLLFVLSRARLCLENFHRIMTVFLLKKFAYSLSFHGSLPPFGVTNPWYESDLMNTMENRRRERLLVFSWLILALHALYLIIMTYIYPSWCKCGVPPVGIVRNLCGL